MRRDGTIFVPAPTTAFDLRQAGVDSCCGKVTGRRG